MPELSVMHIILGAAGMKVVCLVMMQVKPTPPPHFSPPLSISPPTRAQQLRSAAIHAAMQRNAAHRTPARGNGSDSHHTRQSRRPAAHKQAVIGKQAGRDRRHEQATGEVGIGNVPRTFSSQAAGQDTAGQSTVQGVNADDMQTHEAAAAASAAHTGCAAQQKPLEQVKGDDVETQFQHGATLPAAAASRESYLHDRLVAVHVRSELTDSHFDM